jgi:MFS family permease
LTPAFIWRRNLLVCTICAFVCVMGLTLVLPFLPLYVEHLGIHTQAGVVRWSGVAFGATFITAGVMAPLWGRMADRYGKKSMLIRASLGMAVVMTAMTAAGNVYQLTAMRLLMGMVAGYVPAAGVLLAHQVPKERCGWVMGVLSSGALAGNLLGPLLGGFLADHIGVRGTFLVTGGLLLISGLLTWLFVQEAPHTPAAKHVPLPPVWSSIANRRLVITVLCTAMTLQFALMSIEPIVTVFVGQLAPHARDPSLLAGLVVSAPALSSMLLAPGVGRLADRLGHLRVATLNLLGTALVLMVQPMLSHYWAFVASRLVMGMTLAGLLPALSALIRCHVPEQVAGRVYGYMQTSQCLGQIAGPMLGGVVASQFGFHALFFATSVVLLINGLLAMSSVGDKAAPATGTL